MLTPIRPWILLVTLLGAGLVPWPLQASVLGHERWRAELTGELVAQPAVSPAGLIALQTTTGLVVLGADGVKVAKIDGSVSAQPMWSGETLWFRVEGGWRTWSRDGEGPLCPVNVPSGVIGRSGRALFATGGELVGCGEEKPRRYSRRPLAAQLWPSSDGWFAADELGLESISPDGRPRGGGSVTTLGYPAGAVRAGELIVALPSGATAGLDVALHTLWKLPGGVDGPPVSTRSGALVLLSDRTATLVDPPFVSWSLSVPAGVRAAAALDDGSVALLERTGHVAIAREGRVVWSQALRASGNILAAHPAGMLLVQDGGSLVAIDATPPDQGAAFPVMRGIDRSNRRAEISRRARCPAPAAGTVQKSNLRVDGFAPANDGVCAHPSLEVAQAGTAGRRLFSARCGMGCLVAMGTGRVMIGSEDGRIEAWDERGKGKVIRRSGQPLAAIGMAEGRLVTLSRKRLGGAPMGRSVMMNGRLAGRDDKGEAWIGSDEHELVRVRLGASHGGVDGVRAFGETVCFHGGGRAGCVVDGKLAPSIDLTPRVTWFGERAHPCAEGSGVCLASAGLPTVTLWQTDAPVKDLMLVGDGTLGVLSGGRVTVLWPDGTVRWTTELGTSCDGEAWLDRASPGMLVARACGVVAAFETGVRGQTPASR